jgi:predicted MPP superfamily phosphohydrolase
MTRRKFLKLGAGLAGACVAGRATYFAEWEKYDLRLTRWRVPLRRLPAALSGLRIAHFSDVHIHPEIPHDYQVRALNVVGSVRADLIVFTGDLLSYKLSELTAYREAYREPQARYGKYAVLGNRDFQGRRIEPLIDFWRECGWEVLRNESRLLGDHEDFRIVGIDDPVTGRDDFEKAGAGVPEDAFRLMLAHTPDVVETAAAHGGDLLLAGHTHGGQVVLPFIGAPMVPSDYGSRYAWGMFDSGQMRMIVSRGVGCTPPRIRFDCPPEVGLLTLVRDEQFPYHDGPTRGCGPWMSRAR